MRTGRDHVESLKDGRSVFIEGERVVDVTRHPAFAGMVETAAGFFDAALNPAVADVMTFETETGGRANRAWDLPRSYDAWVRRREAMERVAEATCGWVGRSPDHVPSTLTGMLMGLDVFERADPRGARALSDYVRYARDADLYMTYVIINPQADKTKTASGQPGEDLVARIVDEDAGGITIRGAKMLATSGIVANEILISGIQPYGPGDEAYCFTAAIPVASKGLRMLSRRSYEQYAGSTFDYPLSARFDENDAVVWFDDVKIPWDRVFLKGDVKAAFDQWHETRAHVVQNHQCLVRLYVKLRFLMGLARKIAEINGIIAFPSVREKLGELSARTTIIEGMVKGMDAAGGLFNGYWVPDRPMLCAAQATAQRLYPEIVEAIRELSGGGVIMLPSSAADYADPEMAGIIARTQRSPAVDSHERVKTFKLVWDAIGSEFGSRHLQYEMFYSGSSVVLNGHNYRNYDWARATGMVDRLMATYDLPARQAKAAE